MGAQVAAIEHFAEDVLFSSAHAALVFALNYSGQAYDRPMMNRLAAPATGSGKGLAGLDGAAQSGMIRAEIKALGKLAEAILIARIAPRWMPCACRAACCSGRTPNCEWTDAVAILADMVRTTALAGCTAHGLLRRAYIVRYMTAKDARCTIEEIASRYEINRKTAEAHYGKVSKYLRATEAAAEAAIDDRLRTVGMVG